MASPEPLEPSRRLAQAATAERERLVSELAKTENQAATFRKRLRDVEEHARAIRQRLQLLDELGVSQDTQLADTPPPKLVAVGTEPRNGWLRGAAIRQIAVRLLTASARPEQPIHYSHWLELLQGAGYGIQGKDPAATFLTQLSRSPVVVRADTPGTYTLDFSAERRLREHLTRLNDELLALHHGQQMIEQIASARSRRRELVAEIARAERQLEEAIEAVGNRVPAESTLEL